MPELAGEFSSLPVEYQHVIQLAQDQHDVDLRPLQALAGGWSGAILYLVSAASRRSDRVEHYILKLDRTGKKTRADEITRHITALSHAPPDFAQHRMPALALDRVQTDEAVAIFYAIAGQSLHEYRPLSRYTRQHQLETIFQTTNDVLLKEWNAQATFDQAVYPQQLLERWLGFRLKPGQKIERFLADVCRCPPDAAGLLIQGDVFPNPLAYARDAERWGQARPIDAFSGFIHGDLNTNNVLVRFASNQRDLDGYYLIDFALFKEGIPLLYDQRYLEMSYLILNLGEVSLGKMADLVTHFAETDLPDPNQVPVELAGTCAVVGSARQAFDTWVRESHPSLLDDLWGQYWLAGVAAGLSYAHKAGMRDEARLLGLIYAAANLKRYALKFGAPLPAQAAHLYSESRFGDAPQVTISTPAAAGTLTHNLPAQPTALIGRETEIAAVHGMLLKETVRLLTLTGPGGTGKTRLGLQVAAEVLEDFEDGVWFVPLADLTDPELVVSKIAQQFGLREGGSRPLVENLKDYLRDKHLLLVLDNFEHVAAAAPAAVADLLAAAPQLKVLVTSRALLNLRGEHEFPVPPLKLPDDERLPAPERLGEFEAVRLFVERARAANPHFALSDENAPAVAEICRRVDGLPLAIELAAARSKLLQPEAMLDRLSGSLKLLTGGARDLPARQQTLRNTLDWSHGLLGAEEQMLFAWLGVFVGGLTLEAAEAVCGSEDSVDVLEGVASLVNNSLLRREEDAGQARFRMLETIRAYALERLRERGDLDALRRQHARYYAGKIIDETWEKLFSRDAAGWLDWIEDEHDNVRAALAWSQDTPEGLELGPPLIENLTWFWYRRGYISEGRTWAERVLASPAAAEGTAGRAVVLQDGALLAMWQGDLNTALDMAEESLAIWRRLENTYGLAVALMNGGTVLINMGDDEAAHPLLKQAQALFKELGDSYFYGVTLVHLGNVALGLGELAEARSWLDEAHALSRQIDENWLIAFAFNNLGEVARVEGDYERAHQCYTESEALLRAAGDKGDLARLVHNLGYVAQHEGDDAQAEAQFRESLAMFKQLGNKRGIAECLAGLAGLGAAQERPRWAAQLLWAAEALLTESGAAWWPADRVEFARNRAAIQSTLDEDTFAAAWAAGQTMTLEQAIAFASDDVEA